MKETEFKKKICRVLCKVAPTPKKLKIEEKKFDKKNLFSECGRSPLFQKKNKFEIEDKTFFKRVTPSPEKLKVEEKNICTGGCGKSPHFMEEKF